MILVFLRLSFKQTSSLSSFTFIKRLFSSSLSKVSGASSACLRLILIPACPSSSLIILTIYSAYNLNKQSDNVQPRHTPFRFETSLLFHVQFCFFLTCLQISQEAEQVVWYSHLFQNFSQFVLIHTVEGFGIVNEREVDVFLELSFFSMIEKMLAILSLVPVPFLKPA